MESSLNCDTLGNLDDGRARGIINAALARAVADADDRGQDKKPREVNIKVTVSKVNGLLAVEVQAGCKLPSYRTDRTACKIVHKQTRKGTQPTLMFQDMAPDNPDQKTIDEEIENGQD